MTEKHTQMRAFRILVLSIGTFLAIIFLLGFGPKLLCSSLRVTQESSPGHHWEGQVMTAMFLIFMIGYAIGWWRRLWGGIIILLAALLLMGPFIILQGNLGSLIFGLPLLIVGILYVLVYWSEKRGSVQEK